MRIPVTLQRASSLVHARAKKGAACGRVVVLAARHGSLPLPRAATCRYPDCQPFARLTITSACMTRAVTHPLPQMLDVDNAVTILYACEGQSALALLTAIELVSIKRSRVM
jgi:hypothetical protein